MRRAKKSRTSGRPSSWAALAVTLPYVRYRCGFFSGLCSPDLGTDSRLSTKGLISPGEVSGTMRNGFPLRGSGMVRVAAVLLHWPATMFCARAGSSGVILSGSTVAQDPIQRRAVAAPVPRWALVGAGRSIIDAAARRPAEAITVAIVPAETAGDSGGGRRGGACQCRRHCALRSRVQLVEARLLCARDGRRATVASIALI
mmetsp:Transcript_24444/g.61430  ORF Transcript_24444/g.61430 Transcript_24444/m.61430 type:complete len:201 (+) Transcript_24444:1281-1883(+)